MIKPMLCAALALSIASLTGCGDTRAGPPKPQATADTTPPIVLTSPIGNTSVPAAESVLPPRDAATAKDESARPNGTLSRAQESSAMPMPGQVNNHSSTALDPKASGKAASAP